MPNIRTRNIQNNFADNINLMNVELTSEVKKKLCRLEQTRHEQTRHEQTRHEQDQQNSNPSSSN